VNIVLSPQEIDHDWAVKALARVTGVDVDADEFKTVALAAAFAFGQNACCRRSPGSPNGHRPRRAALPSARRQKSEGFAHGRAPQVISEWAAEAVLMPKA
jgi:hypothetical protein